MSTEQRLIQAEDAREQLRHAYRTQATVAHDALERLRKLREALEELIASARGKFGDGTHLECDELQAVLDEHAV
jgi:uncharacterized protein involved in exopolysaccharide biosynthesis